MKATNGMLVLLLIIAFTVGKAVERYAGGHLELIEAYEQNQKTSNILIETLEADNDSLRITRTEFEYAVKLLEEKK